MCRITTYQFDAVATGKVEREDGTMTSVSSGSVGRRGTNAALWVLQVLTAALFVFASIPKLTADPMAVAGFDMMGLGTSGMYAIGVCEVLGAVALLVPILCGLAALAQILLMIGAVTYTAIFFGGGPILILPAVTLIAVSVIAWARRDRTIALIGLVRRYLGR